MRFNNSLRHDIKAIVSLQTWTIDEAVRIGSSMYKTKSDINQSNSSQSGSDAQVDHSKSTHEVDGEKKKITTTTTSTHVINKSSNKPYAHPVGIKCYRCQEVSHTSYQYDDDHSEAFLATVLLDIVDMDACHVLLGRPWQSDLNVGHRGKENTYTFSKDGHKFTLCPYSDEVQAKTTKVKTNQIVLCSIRNKEKNICATIILPDQVLYPIKNLWSSSFQEGENDGGQKLEKRKKKDNSGRINLD
ncbi:hypothetical protein Tco_1003497 [Tanacetum coccineum]|uniref:Uncharacterized protein n=1 Tax=Tanacetum coccineum TaxID=301880 RepID=A0ABQ5FA71_9ASTR